ncbi:lytic polysaccharide monooxygenase [Pandoraea aquatica]|nr:lytic polysaccharide monooxygenase [Pandoraea aquatica]
MTLAAAASTAAYGHGAIESPMARQYQCKLDGGHWQSSDGSAVPNAGCRAAWQILKDENPHRQFDQWNEFAGFAPNQGQNLEDVKRTIPNGLLCAGGDPTKRGMDAPQSAGFRKTEIQNGKMTLTWYATATHNPSFMRAFITKPGWQNTQPLRWEDLEPIYEGETPMPVDDRYRYELQLPPGRTGDAIIYSIWQRRDSGNEGFYNCADVTFKGDGGPPPSPWHYKGPFVTPSLTPVAGDKVRFRVLAGPGKQEIVDERIDITAQNLSSWTWTFAEAISAKHGAIVQIGKKSDSDVITFDRNDIPGNASWATDKNAVAVTSLIPGGGDPDPVAPPEARISGASTVKPGETLTLTNAGTNGPNYRYDWHVHGFTPMNGTASSWSGQAPSAPGKATATLVVTDIEGRTSRASHDITITGDGGGQHPVWPAGLGSYKAGDVVTGLDGQAWACKPFPHGAWCNIAPNTTPSQWPYAPGGSGVPADEAQRAWKLAN